MELKVSSSKIKLGLISSRDDLTVDQALLLRFIRNLASHKIHTLYHQDWSKCDVYVHDLFKIDESINIVIYPATVKNFRMNTPCETIEYPSTYPDRIKHIEDNSDVLLIVQHDDSRISPRYKKRDYIIITSNGVIESNCLQSLF